MNNFDKITESQETLAEFLEELNCVDTPWDNAFYRAFCDNCTAENCEGEDCQHAEQQDKAYWWPMQEAGE